MGLVKMDGDEWVWMDDSNDGQSEDFDTLPYLNIKKDPDSIDHNHIETKKETEVTKYSCNYCEYKTISKYVVNTHIKTQHENLRYPCNKCNYIATKRCYLKMHIETKHEGKVYSCEKCVFKTICHPYLKDHNIAFHMGVKFSCNKCE